MSLPKSRGVFEHRLKLLHRLCYIWSGGLVSCHLISYHNSKIVKNNFRMVVMVIRALNRTIKSSMQFFGWQSTEKYVLHLCPAEVIELPDRSVDNLGQLTFGSHNIKTSPLSSSVAYQSGFQISQFCFRSTQRR